MNNFCLYNEKYNYSNKQSSFKQATFSGAYTIGDQVEHKLFGRGKIPQLMGDMAKGIKSFKKGMTEEEKKEDTNIEKKTDEEK